LNRKEASGLTSEVTPDIEAGINSSRDGGRPLAQSTRSFFEARFGYDFGHVLTHTGSSAAASAGAINAKAYTVGHDIIFGDGQFAPETPAGKHLLAHELAHVVQQSGHGYAARLSTPTVQRQPVKPAPPMTRAEEIQLSFNSPGEISGTLNPPMISLYNFAIDQPTLKKEHLAALQAIAFVLKLFPGAKARVEAKGHADSTGDDTTINQPLSGNRALEVKKALQSAAPVAVSHCGELCPVATNDTVAGRSRNRRVDIYIVSGKKPDDFDWPSLCSFAPVLCLCLKNPALCRKKDGDGIDWPCSGLLGALICGTIVCIAASAILRNPFLCLPGLPGLPELLCLLFPSLCKPKQPEKDKKRRACPLSVDLPEGKKVVDATDTAFPHYSFDMLVTFKQESPDKSPYCDCNCGEYRQYIRGFFMHPDYGGTRAKLQEHKIAYGKLLDRDKLQEDGDKKGNPYGHRYEDAARTRLRSNSDKNDQFLDPDNRETGCKYKGHDDPGVENSPQDRELHVHLWFRGGPFDACNNREEGAWKRWEVIIDRVPQPPRTPKQPPIICAGLPPDAKVGDTVTLFVKFEGYPEECYGKIDVRIIDLSSTKLSVLTRNSDRLNIAPEDCLDMWINSYQVWTFYGSPPCEHVA
jgi:outer membrane protein OmpA-like peptidoglycan-associated protein